MVDPAFAQNILKCYGQPMSLQTYEQGLLRCHSLRIMELHFSKDILPMLLGFLATDTRKCCKLAGNVHLISFLVKDIMLGCMSKQTDIWSISNCQIYETYEPWWCLFTISRALGGGKKISFSQHYSITGELTEISLAWICLERICQGCT